MKIFHILPKNLIPSGGIKVHYQLCQLERELGYDSFIVYDDILKVPTWFAYNVRHITTVDMHRMADKKKDVIVGWEDVEPLLRSGFYHKVSYIQGEVFVNRANLYHGITLWFSNDFNRLAVPHLADNDWYIVTPFIDKSVFNYSVDEDYTKRKYMFSIQERKAGHEAFNKLRAELDFPSTAFLQDICQMHFIQDCHEQDFANQLRDTKIFITHTYPEGFGLPALEAMASGCLVVGFTGGGGNTYMEHGSNCLIASKDGDYKTLGRMLEIAHSMVIHCDSKEVREYIRLGYLTTERYHRVLTKQQLATALSLFEEKA